MVRSLPLLVIRQFFNSPFIRVPDIQLSVRHPKRRFVRQALEYEIRLSYYDRILRTLPEAMQSPEARCMPDETPGPEYEYDDPCEWKLSRHHPSLILVL